MKGSKTILVIVLIALSALMIQSEKSNSKSSESNKYNLSKKLSLKELRKTKFTPKWQDRFDFKYGLIKEIKEDAKNDPELDKLTHVISLLGNNEQSILYQAYVLRNSGEQDVKKEFFNTTFVDRSEVDYPKEEIKEKIDPHIEERERKAKEKIKRKQEKLERQKLEEEAKEKKE